ncbi:hypothetical protein [Mycolicibacterium iranicum]|uniref:hypothetical protein n=1 Tax=Mycolicibacterium iranicum TaxID=912594 RepID=UPI0013FD1C48|nr:hypothetical protein [Mycolicibacterium iranicum]
MTGGHQMPREGLRDGAGADGSKVHDPHRLSIILMTPHINSPMLSCVIKNCQADHGAWRSKVVETGLQEWASITFDDGHHRLSCRVMIQ